MAKLIWWSEVSIAFNWIEFDLVWICFVLVEFLESFVFVIAKGFYQFSNKKMTFYIKPVNDNYVWLFVIILHCYEKSFWLVWDYASHTINYKSNVSYSTVLFAGF